MLFNRAYINELKAENEKLKRKKEEYEDEMIKSMNSRDSYKNANRKLINDIGQLKAENKELKRENHILECTNEYMEDIYDDLKDDMEVKEDSITNLLEANKELSLSNNYLENKINTLEKIIKKHEENECRLNQEKCRVKGQLEKLRNVYKMQTGIDILEGEDAGCLK